MGAPKRGVFILTLEASNCSVIKQGLYERDFWRFDFRDDHGKRYTYGGKIYAIFIGKRYRVTATCHGFAYGAYQLKRPKFEREGEAQHALFEG